MSKIFEDKACAEELLRIILDRDDLSVQRVKTQYVVNSLQGHSVKLDIYAVDRNNKIYDIEVQNDNKAASFKRARYNLSIIDANELAKGEDYDSLPEVYSIFITKNDVLGGDRLIYHIDRTIKEMGNACFSDEAHIIYVYAKKKSDSELGKLMQDFFCKEADLINNEIISKRVSHFKEEKEGVSEMCAIMDELIEKATTESAIKLTLEHIKNIMNNSDVTVEKAMTMLGIPEKDRDMYIKLILAE